ncbi:hypothetical protein MRX96_037234 [Rhipicephalus microplus]
MCIVRHTYAFQRNAYISVLFTWWTFTGEAQTNPNPPKVLPFVIPKNLLVGERISITCSAASGTKPLTFMWIKDDATLHRGSALRITDSSDYSTLSIENLKTSDAGNYTCVVSNSGGTASHSDVLQVKAAPSWTVEPRDVTVTAGETITLNCNGTGFPPPKIGWIREGGAAADVYGGSIIRIASASKKDEADYKCHISNGVGEDLYKSVRVTVKLSTKISPFIFSKNLLVGERTSVMCATTSGDQPLTFAWLKDGKPLHQSANINIASSPQFSTLSVQKLSLGDAGNYTCAVSNAQGTVSYTDVLEVKAPPAWLVEPVDVHVTYGQIVTLSCRAEGFPPPTVTWTRNGKTFTKLAADTVNIASVSKTDEGSYTCRVENGVGGPLEKTVQLTVKPPPRILPFAFPRTLTVGETTSVTCTTAAGDKTFKYIWLKDGSAVHPGENVKIVTSPDISVLKIDKLTLSDAGNYTCVVSNGGGTVSHASTLEIKGNARSLESSAGNLTLSSVTKEHQASYTCEISNGIGEPLRKTVTLLVKTPPSIAPFQFPKNLEVQQRISAMCTISVGERPLRFAWLKDGSALASGSKNVRIVDNAEYSTLHIDVLTLNSAGNYTCSVTNDAGYATYTAPLLVHAPPRWLIEPKDVIATAETNVTITCSADGFPVPTITWQKSGKCCGIYKLHSQSRFSDWTTLTENHLYAQMKVRRQQGSNKKSEARRVSLSTTPASTIKEATPAASRMASGVTCRRRFR